MPSYPALLLSFAVLAWSMPAAAAPAAERAPARAAAAVADDDTARVIVRFKPAVRTERALAAARPGVEPALQMARTLSLRRGVTLADGPSIDARTQVVVAHGIGAASLAARLAGDDDVEWVEVDRRQRVARVPNDPLYPLGRPATPVAGQWYLRASNANEYAATDFEAAWAHTRGAPGIAVAVIDTGVRFDHPDLGRVAEGGKLLPGYDFVADVATANDGDGRDADPSDPGDWISAADRTSGAFGRDNCVVADSSWHGTQVAGLVGAATDNGIGVAGAGWDVHVLPVRALGKCGGFVSDIAAAIRWAAGLAVPGVPSNPHPARVINLSLGSPNRCAAAYQSAIDAARGAGAVVVAAAGNEGVAVNQPGNCAGVVTVAGVRHAGTKVGYSNLGPQVALAAPAGNCVNLSGTCLYPLSTTSNDGTTVPANPTYTGGDDDATYGTSFASPLAAAAAALMLSLHPGLQPDTVAARLRASTRAFPPRTEEGIAVCRVPAGFDDTAQLTECHCTAETCGAGLLDAGAAVAAALPPQALVTWSPTRPRAGEAVVLGGAASTAAAGSSVASWRWSLEGGSAEFTGATDAVAATLRTRSAGVVRVALLVSDDQGRSDHSVVEITVAEASSGGASHPGWLLALALACGAVAAANRRPSPLS